MADVIWISWQEHRRTTGICDYLALDLHVVTSPRRSAARYLRLVRETLRILRRERPRVLFVQNPSIVLTAFAVLARPLFGYRLVVDAHNEAVRPYVHDSRAVRIAGALLMRAADLTIVTNRNLAEIVRARGGDAFVLPDRLPVIGGFGSVELAHGSFNIVLIATFAADEPVMPVLDAAAMLQQKITLYVTGNHARLDESVRRGLPPNIVFTGYLTDADYWGYLKSADAIIDLTSMDDCLVCGAYEGVAAARPLLLSANDATIRYFSKGVVYTDNSAQDIRRAMLELVDRHEALSAEIAELGTELPADWRRQAEGLKRIIGQWL